MHTGMLESMARIEGEAYRLLSRLGVEPPVSEVHTAGGGAVNEKWMAMRAREIGVPVVKAAQGKGLASSCLSCSGHDALGGCQKRNVVVLCWPLVAHHLQVTPRTVLHFWLARQSRHCIMQQRESTKHMQHSLVEVPSHQQSHRSMLDRGCLHLSCNIVS